MSTDEILVAIQDKRNKQYDIAVMYIQLITSLPSNSKDWGVINRAIIERWSMSGLERVKTLAWKWINLKT